MKTVTINVSEPVYRDFQKYAEAHDRTASELIREAMQEYCQNHLSSLGSVRDIQPVSVGKVQRPLTQDEDFLGEMLHENRA